MKKLIITVLVVLAIAVLLAVALSCGQRSAPAPGKPAAVQTVTSQTSATSTAGTLPNYAAAGSVTSTTTATQTGGLSDYPPAGQANPSPRQNIHPPPDPDIARGPYNSLAKDLYTGPFMRKLPYQDSTVSIDIGPDGTAGGRVELMVQYEGSQSRATTHVGALMRAAGDNPGRYAIIYLAR